MLAALTAVVLGLVILLWSADQFVEGAAAVARHLGVPPLLIGMVVVGFGTSAPEMVVSALAAMADQPGIALGNAYGSNIANIALILGMTALVSPISVHSQVLRRELPLLAAVTVFAAFQLRDGAISRVDAWLLLGVFAAVMAWTLRQGRSQPADRLGTEMAQALSGRTPGVGSATVRVVAGLVLLVASSRLLVWGAVGIARGLGVSDLLIGLTIVAVGTSLPELASSLAAARRGEHDLAVGNVLGSNLFNTLVVVGIAGAIRPLAATPDLLSRDIPVMAALTAALFVVCRGFRGPGRITRAEGLGLLLGYAVYLAWLAGTAMGV